MDLQSTKDDAESKKLDEQTNALKETTSAKLQEALASIEKNQNFSVVDAEMAKGPKTQGSRIAVVPVITGWNFDELIGFPKRTEKFSSDAMLQVINNDSSYGVILKLSKAIPSGSNPVEMLKNWLNFILTKYKEMKIVMDVKEANLVDKTTTRQTATDSNGFDLVSWIHNQSQDTSAPFDIKIFDGLLSTSNSTSKVVTNYFGRERKAVAYMLDFEAELQNAYQILGLVPYVSGKTVFTWLAQLPAPYGYGSRNTPENTSYNLRKTVFLGCMLRQFFAYVNVFGLHSSIINMYSQQILASNIQFVSYRSQGVRAMSANALRADFTNYLTNNVMGVGNVAPAVKAILLSTTATSSARVEIPVGNVADVLPITTIFLIKLFFPLICLTPETRDEIDKYILRIMLPSLQNAQGQNPNQAGNIGVQTYNWAYWIQAFRNKPYLMQFLQRGSQGIMLGGILQNAYPALPDSSACVAGTVWPQRKTGGTPLTGMGTAQLGDPSGILPVMLDTLRQIVERKEVAVTNPSSVWFTVSKWLEALMGNYTILKEVLHALQILQVPLMQIPYAQAFDDTMTETDVQNFYDYEVLIGANGRQVQSQQPLQEIIKITPLDLHSLTFLSVESMEPAVISPDVFSNFFSLTNAIGNAFNLYQWVKAKGDASTAFGTMGQGWTRGVIQDIISPFVDSTIMGWLKKILVVPKDTNAMTVPTTQILDLIENKITENKQFYYMSSGYVINPPYRLDSAMPAFFQILPVAESNDIFKIIEFDEAITVQLRLDDLLDATKDSEQRKIDREPHSIFVKIPTGITLTDNFRAALNQTGMEITPNTQSLQPGGVLVPYKLLGKGFTTEEKTAMIFNRGYNLGILGKDLPMRAVDISELGSIFLRIIKTYTDFISFDGVDNIVKFPSLIEYIPVSLGVTGETLVNPPRVA